jgi:hypothetical protein
LRVVILRGDRDVHVHGRLPLLLSRSPSCSTTARVRTVNQLRRQGARSPGGIAVSCVCIRQCSAARLFCGAGSAGGLGGPSRPSEGERSAETALGACEAPLRAIGTPGRISRRPTSLAIGTPRLSALHCGISRTGASEDVRTPRVRGGYEPRRQGAAPGSAFRTVSGDAPR